MSLILRVPGVSFTDTSIPILRNDIVANAGTLEIFDALDADISWPSQSDPAEGTDTWKSLLSANTAAFAGAIGFSGGFTLDATADVITMPSTFKIPASGKGVVIFWIKVNVQAFTSGTNNLIAHVGSFGDNQFICYMIYGADDDSTYIGMYTANNSLSITPQPISSLPATRIAQLAVAMELIDGVYVFKTFLNGVRISTDTSALTSLPQPGSQMRFGGSGNAVNQTVLRTLVDDLSVTTPEALVALDYASNVGRFA